VRSFTVKKNIKKKKIKRRKTRRADECDWKNINGRATGADNEAAENSINENTPIAESPSFFSNFDHFRLTGQANFCEIDTLHGFIGV